jgi:pimeloyl-ACP methyl ester carboxylesterase
MQFTLVGHSMGGLVSRAYLASHRADAQRRIKRVIMLGTPHFGAAGAVADIAMGNRMMAIAAKLHEGNDLRSMALNMPSAYQLLPAPRDLFTPDRPYPADFDPYDADAWQLPGIRSDFLEAGRRFHELLANHDHPVELIQIAGCHVETTVDVQRRAHPDGRPDFQVVRKDKGPDSGDGTVPLWSAQLPGATIYYVQDVHRYLPRNSEIVRATLDLIHGQAADLPTVLPEPKSGLFQWRGTGGSVEQQAEELRQHLQEGNVSEEDLELLYFMGT